MQRYKLILEYYGTPYVGFQRQKNGSSVQSTVEEALLKLTESETIVFAAGRTDAGVHALGQVIHCDVAKPLSPFNLIHGLNFYLQDESIRVVAADPVPSTFHARFSAVRRHYVYHILNREAPSPLLHNRVWHISKPLDVSNMQESAQYLIGLHDFTTFRAQACQAKSAIKSIENLSVQKKGQEILIEVSAPSFLHHQVRNIVGSLVYVGLKKWKPGDMDKALKAKDRAEGGPTAPASGLYFKQVDYQE
jgi:tRNA pseudouridine38-40 synthase